MCVGIEVRLTTRIMFSCWASAGWGGIDTRWTPDFFFNLWNAGYLCFSGNMMDLWVEQGAGFCCVMKLHNPWRLSRHSTFISPNRCSWRRAHSAQTTSRHQDIQINSPLSYIHSLNLTSFDCVVDDEGWNMSRCVNSKCVLFLCLSVRY